ncbi:A/G-specific adenine glycosylase [Wohlfahrtiimonas chitiniclastica]|uniref:A/G-specific adenine glycosylase n=1 Tax=Wohlfahrtiimonas chitiniclastica TaxID=400946 RepID=UPI001BCFB4B1|nr:A/G-specific adenine glycosylase [Wohlfahrtiimonas chitiniclastica]MBS7816175.1 A/G-specific adenine glycosylase [Wohlfahrtiimonas chitiniclastica]MBS7821830.1 A/G-specific adenine glycosylase [Wohlfahrtiimonas chitiniclastica]MBS7829622.1 A/G-specific adenine glycosylase [Wohlfahrtiimonas chitiniclastica]MBS7831589.1 A/G-specific adenine glycosylase [Wohlfahrtiimonas chitiniclastica]
MSLFLAPTTGETLRAFHQQLMQWFDEHGRHDLPWKPQDHYTPAQNIYHIWLSEIMLQQTQVATVIPYFFNFIEQFPTINALADAEIERVLKAWEGLGYYARARNLHQGAQYVRDQFNGEIPCDFAAIESIKGIGRTTAAAIMSQGFNRPFAILDGNVKRVMARVTGAMHPEKQLEKVLLPFAYMMSSQARPNDYTQAVMDFGATVCTKQPKCTTCFWQAHCITFQQQQVAMIPAKKIKAVKKDLELFPIIVENQHGELLFHQRTTETIWHNLYEFPHLSSHLLDIEEMMPNVTVIESISLPRFKHVLTHINFHIEPLWIKVTTDEPSIVINGQCYAFTPRDIYETYAKTKPTNDLLDAIHG